MENLSYCIGLQQILEHVTDWWPVVRYDEAPLVMLRLLTTSFSDRLVCHFK